jgi:ring-1,2-phenylacetyl-CoA epoxidase subunit PaaE
MTPKFHSLHVIDTCEEIGGRAKSVVFGIPDVLAKTFRWRPGQHLTLRFTLKGEETRRCYSISSSPCSGDPLRITVKRVKKGLVSNHINDVVRAGDKIDVMAPFGGFCLDPDARLRRTHYFFGAGSGFTPLFSMLHSVLCAEPYSVAHLVYANKKPDTILFRDRLGELVKRHPGRLTVSHVLSHQSMWSSFTPWRKGRIDAAAITTAIGENPPYAQDVHYYICGPGGMNRDVKSFLTKLDVPVYRIHMESYGGAVEINEPIKGIAAMAAVSLDGQSHSVKITEDQTVLKALRAADLEPPFSCQSGVCGACKAKLVRGSVQMRSHMALEDRELAHGHILTCQSVPTTPDLELSFE